MKKRPEQAHSPNASCTSVQMVAPSFTPQINKAWKSRALPENILAILNDLFLYDASLGRLIWRDGGGVASREYADKGYSYRVVNFHSATLRESRAIWMMANDCPIPDGQEIDHINGDPTDNHIENLRLANRAQNQWNAKTRKDNTSGLKGVTQTRSGTFAANISINGKVKYLGPSRPP